MHQADPRGASGIDLHVVRSAVAAVPSKAPGMELHVGRYQDLPPEIEAGVVAAPDLLAELSMARAGGRALIGAEPRDVIGAVPAEWIRERGRHWLVTWTSLTHDRENAAFMVLTACRIWRFTIEEVHCSKAEAARWALARDASLTAVGEAMRQRMVDPSTPVNQHGIRKMLETVLDDIATAERRQRGHDWPAG